MKPLPVKSTFWNIFPELLKYQSWIFRWKQISCLEVFFDISWGNLWSEHLSVQLSGLTFFLTECLIQACKAMFLSRVMNLPVLNTLHWELWAATELMCVMIIQIVNTGIISSRWDLRTAFAEESAGTSPQCSRPHNKGQGSSQDESYNWN